MADSNYQDRNQDQMSVSEDPEGTSGVPSPTYSSKTLLSPHLSHSSPTPVLHLNTYNSTTMSFPKDTGSLEEVINKANRAGQVLSPSASICTGDTGSTEPEGRASESLAASLELRRQLSSRSSSSIEGSYVEVSRPVQGDSGRSPASEDNFGDESEVETSAGEDENNFAFPESLTIAGLEDSIKAASTRVTEWVGVSQAQVHSDGISTLNTDQSDSEISSGHNLLHYSSEISPTPSRILSDDNQLSSLSNLERAELRLQSNTPRSQVHSSDGNIESQSDCFSDLEPLLPASALRGRARARVPRYRPFVLPPPLPAPTQQAPQALMSTSFLSTSNEVVLWKARCCCLAVALVAVIFFRSDGTFIATPLITAFIRNGASTSKATVDPPALIMPSLPSYTSPIQNATGAISHNTSLATNATATPSMPTINTLLPSGLELYFYVMLCTLTLATYVAHRRALPGFDVPNRLRNDPNYVQDEDSEVDTTEATSEAGSEETVKNEGDPTDGEPTKSTGAATTSGPDATDEQTSAESVIVGPSKAGDGKAETHELLFTSDLGEKAIESGEDVKLDEGITATEVIEPTVEELTTEGQRLFLQGEYEKARSTLEQAIDQDRQSAIAHEYLGKTLMHLGRGAVGRSHLYRAIELDSESYSTRAFLGDHYFLWGSIEEAKEHLDAAIELRQDYPAAHACLGLIAIEESEPEVAQKQLKLFVDCKEGGYNDRCLAKTVEAFEGSKLFQKSSSDGGDEGLKAGPSGSTSNLSTA